MLYDAWAGCQGNWQTSTFLKTIRDRHRSTKRGTRKWLTAAQMDTMFGLDLASAMRTRKVLDSELMKKEVREHPELPGCEAG